MFHSLSVFSHPLFLCVLSFYLKSWYARQRTAWLSCLWGVTLCYASSIGIMERDRREDFKVYTVIFNWMYTIFTTNHCLVQVFARCRKKNVVPLSPLCQTLHNVSQPFFHLKPLTGLASNQCGLSRGNGGFAHCTFFYFCIFRVYQLRASIAPSPFVQCLNQIKHLWWSVSKFTCLSQRKVPVMDEGRNWGNIS